MNWIYLSPHLDDAVYSCGGLIWEQTQAGQEVEVWTIFSGDPLPPLSQYAQSLHERWGTGMDASGIRRNEDLAACERLAARARHFDLPDCIYRRSKRTGQPIVQSDPDLFAPIHPDERTLSDNIASLLAAELPTGAQLVIPLTLGGHMDHRIVCAAAELLGRIVFYYPDFPYAADRTSMDEFAAQPMQAVPGPVSDAGLAAWQDAVACYRSQISTFWTDEPSMRRSLEEYWRAGGGQSLLGLNTGER